jgi:hypothetical protein
MPKVQNTKYIRFCCLEPQPNYIYVYIVVKSLDTKTQRHEKHINVK